MGEQRPSKLRALLIAYGAPVKCDKDAVVHLFGTNLHDRRTYLPRSEEFQRCVALLLST